MKHPVIPLFTALLLAPLGSPVLFAASPGPERGFVSSQAATNWEHALTSGNGKFGALIYGQPLDETIVLNHARLFMPLHEPIPPVDTASHLKEIRQMLADGHYQRAADFVVELSKKEGYSEKRWTDPFVPAFEPPLSPGFRWGGCGRVEKANPYQLALRALPDLRDSKQRGRSFCASPALVRLGAGLLQRLGRRNAF